MASDRLVKLRARRIDPQVTTAKLLNEAYLRIQQSESVQYVIGAMQPIDPEYTRNTFAEGGRVCSQLDRRLTISCDYEYQGSVTNDTHIRAKSDIDALALVKHFHSLEQPQVASRPYQGDPLQDLVDLRAEAIQVLRNAFPEVTVDASGSKSITLSGGSLRRKVDVVPANWYNTNMFASTGLPKYRGVQILDAANRVRIKNTPFLHNAKIDEKDIATNGGLRKAARLMKSLKYDRETIGLSSYDIVSIAYSMPVGSLTFPHGQELALLGACVEFCRRIRTDLATREALLVPDGHRKIFETGHASSAGLDQLVAELEALAGDVLRENQRSFRKLAEARVEY